jgi:T1SS-143 domain-containing protein
VQALNSGGTLTDSFTYTVGDPGLLTDLAQLTVTIAGANDAPVAVADTATVSEEGLTGGNPDSVGNPTDTTNSETFSGQIDVSDVDGDSLTVTLGNPAPVLTSGGQSVTWTGVGTSTLVGNVGTTQIIEVTITDDGAYTVTLTGPIDHPNTGQEDIKTFTVPVNVSDAMATTQTSLSITIEDDAPVAEPNAREVAESTLQTVDIQFIVDRSGSMFASGGGGLGFDVPGYSDDRIGLARYSMEQLLLSNDQIQNVQIIRFDSDAQGTVWMSKTQALAFIQNPGNWDAGGGTDYDAALQTAITSYGGGPSTASDQSLVYFISDGAPTEGGGITGNGNPPNVSIAEWESHVTTQGIDQVFAIGIGSNVSVDNLAPIAYPNTDVMPPSGVQDNVVLVTAPNVTSLLAQLEDLLNVPNSVAGNILLDDPGGTGADSFGADGGRILSITVDGVIYTWDGATTITKSGADSGTLSGTSISVETAVGGTFTFYFAQSGANAAGAWTYLTGESGNESFAYVLVDGDGDQTPSALNIEATPANDRPTVTAVSATETQINFTISDPDSTSFTLVNAPVAFAAAFANPTLALGGNALSPTQQALDLSGTLQISDGAGGTANVIGLFLGTSAGNTATAAIVGSPNALYGFGGNDVLTGGTAADFLFGGAHNDTFNLATGHFVAGELIDGGADTDTITLTTTGDGQSIDFTAGTITNVENLTTVDGGFFSNHDQTFTVTATQWAGLTSIDMNDGIDILHVLAAGDISDDLTLPTVTEVETGNLTGTGVNDSVTLSGAQLDAILIGGGTINLGGGITDTINLTSTSSKLNALSNTALTNAEIISASTATSNVKINLNVQGEAFAIFGGSGNDTLAGGTANDSVTGNAGIDQFRLRTNGGSDTIEDYFDGTDKIGFFDNDSNNNGGSVNFSNTNATTAGAELAANDFVGALASISDIVSQDQDVIRLTGALTSSQISGGAAQVSSGAANNDYVIVFNSTTGRGEIWFDTNWSNTSNRSLVATLDSITTLEQLNAIGPNDIVAYDNAADPLILDLGAPGFAFSGLVDGVAFDINGDGVADQMAWTAGEDGILALDVDGSGTIDNGTEIFSPYFAGGNHANGVAALATLDGNADGLIDSNDAAYGDLKVWQDLDHDGTSDTGELAGLADRGITGISLDVTPVETNIDGQQVLAEGTFHYAEGTSSAFVEVALDTALGTVPESSADASVDGDPGGIVATGGDGPASLAGDTGNDNLTAGAGPDTFQFAPGFGHDTIVGFTQGEDKIEFDQAIFATIDEILAHAQQVGSDAVIITGDPASSVTLTNVDVSTVTASDFAIHQSSIVLG